MRRINLHNYGLVGSCAGMLSVALAASGCSHHAKSEATDESATPAVQIAQPQVRTIVRTVEQPSFVESYERSSVYPKMTAYIEKWNVDIGDKVKRGDVLAKLFVPELVEEWNTKKALVKLDNDKIALAKEVVQVAEADVKAANASLSESREMLGQFQAEADRWQSEVDRLTREVNRGVVAPQVLLESKNQFKSSVASRDAQKATIMKAEADLLSKQAQQRQQQISVDVATADLAVAESESKRLAALVGYLVLPAPFDGIITARNANTFDFVLPATGDPSAMRSSPFLSPSGAGAPIYVVERTDVVRVFVDVPEQDANFVQPGSKAMVLISAFQNQPIAATVTRTAWSLNTRSRTLRAEIDLPNTDSAIPQDLPEFTKKSLAEVKLPKTQGQILPGMYAYGSIIINRPNVWAVRQSSLNYENGKAFVWTCENSHATRTEVRTGVTDGEWTELTGRRPLEHGDQQWASIDGSEQVIVTDNPSALSEGALVRIAPVAERDAVSSAAKTDR